MYTQVNVLFNIEAQEYSALKDGWKKKAGFVTNEKLSGTSGEIENLPENSCLESFVHKNIILKNQNLVHYYTFYILLPLYLLPKRIIP